MGEGEGSPQVGSALARLAGSAPRRDHRPRPAVTIRREGCEERRREYYIGIGIGMRSRTKLIPHYQMELFDFGISFVVTNLNRYKL